MLSVYPHVEVSVSNVPMIALNNGVEIPQLGFGVFQIPPAETTDATLAAIDVGYRHIDTAELYRNEAEVGEAVRTCGVARDQIFVTSKLNNSDHEFEAALEAFDLTMVALGLEYLDLFLIHWPVPMKGDFVETWRAMESIQSSGRCRSIGVSNFEPKHLQALFDAGLTVPSVNQIEAHPYLSQPVVRDFDAEHGIVTEAWSPIAQGKVLGDAVLVGIGERLGRTSAQVTLRWHVQRGDVVFPKTVNRARMEENFAIFDFELTADDMAAIDALNRDDRTGPHPDTWS
jgi:2,5-diketo-D-gluconate reductase A